MTTTCKACEEPFNKDRGEPFHTKKGKLCTTCLRKSGLDCDCYLHRIYRNDPGLAGAVAARMSKLTANE